MGFEVKPFGWKRNVDYIKVNFYIMWKTLLEYRANLYGSLIDQIFYIVIQFFFFFIVYSSFGDVLNWQLEDYFLFVILVDLIKTSAALFVWKGGFDKFLLEGGLNKYLSKPNLVFFNYYFSNISSIAFFYLVSDLILLFLFSFMVKMSLIYLVLFVLILSFLFFIFKIFLESFSLLKIGLGKIFYDTYHSFLEITEIYPSSFFKGFKYKFVLNIIPYYFVGSLFLPVLRGYEILDLEFQLILLFGTCLFLSFGTIILWHYGLKRYEAFG